MAEDSQGGHDEVDLTAVLESVRAAPAIIHDDEGASSLQITDVIADYQYASSGHEIDLSALFDNFADSEALDEAGPQTIAAESSASGPGDEIDLSALFDAGGHAGSAQTAVGSPAGVGGEGFAAFTGSVVHPGVGNALYGDDSYDHTGTATG